MNHIFGNISRRRKIENENAGKAKINGPMHSVLGFPKKIPISNEIISEKIAILII